jgi:hypothetical protein
MLPPDVGVEPVDATLLLVEAGVDATLDPELLDEPVETAFEPEPVDAALDPVLLGEAGVAAADPELLGDAAGLAVAMEELLRDPARAERLGAAGRAHVLGASGWPMVARRARAALAELVGSAAG